MGKLLKNVGQAVNLPYTPT